MPDYSVSGDAENIYVSDGDGRIVATCTTLDDAERIARRLNGEPEPFYPFGRLDPNDPLDQAFVNAFNGGAERARARRASHNAPSDELEKAGHKDGNRADG